MSKHETATPQRALSTNFTETTLRRSISAKKRYEWRSRVKGLFTMRKTLLKHPVGALIAVVIAAVGSIGVYAAINWFEGDVKVTSDNSLMNVDLSSCNKKTLPGIEPNSDWKNVKFKITGEPHINSETLRSKLLAICEYFSVHDFYAQRGLLEKIGFNSGTVKETNGYSLKLTYYWGGTLNEKVLSIKQDTTFFDKGQPMDPKDLKAGDTVVFVYDLPADSGLENYNPMDDVASLKSIFRTQYDTTEYIRSGKNLYGSENNIMPLDTYDQLHKK